MTMTTTMTVTAVQHTGTIKYVNADRGFGYITPTAGTPDVFFAFNQLRGSAARLPRKGEAVIYEAGTNARGPVATAVYNLSDAEAVEEHQADMDTAARLQAAKETAQAGQAAFKAALIEKNRQWRAARQPAPDTPTAPQAPVQDMSIPRAQRAAIAHRAWLAKRDADRAALTGDEYRFWAVVRMWGSMTLDREDTTRAALAMSLQAKGRVTTTADGDCLIVRLATADR